MLKRKVLTAMVAAALAPAGLLAQDEEKQLGWMDVAELTFVMTAGNASSSTFGLKNSLTHVWDNAVFTLKAGGIRTEASTYSRTATGTPTSFTISETEISDVTAENYFLRSRFDRNVSDAVYVFGGAGWERNTFAGFDNRYSVVAGTGRTWFDSDLRRFKTDVGLTYTSQDDITPDPTIDDAFLGLRASWDFFRQISSTTGFDSQLIVDENLNQTDDFRADFTNSLSVAMSESLALKTSLQLLFDNLPSLLAVPLTGGGGDALTPLDKLDSIFTVAIVANF